MGLHPKAIDLSLGRIERLLAALGNPERHLPPVIHIAGTNGKGSLVAYLDAILAAAGYRSHVYTSPHLVRFAERIRLGGTMIDEAHLCDVLLECERANEGAPITFFEITTAAAFLAFARSPADAVILETGLGGRLDATNLIARPLVTAITPVSIDHVDFLGGTIEGIAAEKAGILKPGVAAVIGPQPEAVDAVIAARALDVGAPFLRAGIDWRTAPDQDRWRFSGLGLDAQFPRPALLGRHQIDNAATAVACTTCFDGFAIGRDAITEGLVTAVQPARLQRLTRGPLVDGAGGDAELWLDGGHNPAAGAVLAAAAADYWADRPLDLVIGMMGNKDHEGFLRPLAGRVRRARAVAIPGQPNGADPDVLADAARHAGLAEAAPAPDIDAAVRALSDGGPCRILICGSLYLAGEVLRDNG